MTQGHHMKPPASDKGLLGFAGHLDHMKGLTPPGEHMHPIHLTPPHPARLRPPRTRRGMI